VKISKFGVRLKKKTKPSKLGAIIKKKGKDGKPLKPGACEACLGKRRAHTCGTHRPRRGSHFPARPSFPAAMLFLYTYGRRK
jgi:hypothetical protein